MDSQEEEWLTVTTDISENEVDELFNEFKKQYPNSVIEVIATNCDESELNNFEFDLDQATLNIDSFSPTKYGVCDSPKTIRPINIENTFDELSETNPSPNSTLCNVEQQSDDNKTHTFSDDDNNEDDPDYIPNEQEDEDILENEGNMDITVLNQDDIPDSEQNNVEPNFGGDVNQENGLGRMKRKRRKLSEPEEWRDNKNIKLREKGKTYEGWSKKKRGTERKERKMGLPCSSQYCQKSNKRQCQEVTEAEREILFKTFWETLNWDQKKMYIISLVQCSEKNTTRKKPGEASRRQKSVTYTLKCSNGKSVKVCKMLFLSTFDIGEWTVLNWVSDNFDKGGHGMTPSKEVVVKQRRQTNQRNLNKNVDGKDILKKFIESLPKLPSHYCRKNTSKIYLEPIYGNNMFGVFNEYKRICSENENGPVQYVSRCAFDNYISKLNLSFQQPKKDRCDKCIMYEVGNLTEQQYKNHLDKKNRAREEKERDKENAIAGSVIVLTMVVQAVKVCPSLNASALYYKTKLCCHNFSIYDLASHKVKCYWFNETQSDLAANTFASCVIDFLINNYDGSKPVILWSDGCTPQNRNCVLSNALLAYSAEKKVQVEQKFLIKGHTQMEVDCVHSLIERKIKNKKIHLPSDFLRLTEEARSTPSPLEVKELSFEFTKNYGAKHLLVYDSIRPGKKPGDLKVTNIRAIKYFEGKIEVKTNFNENYKPIPHRPKRSCQPLSSFSQMFSSPLKIAKRKWQDLQDLKSVIPQDCHLFYDHLPHDEN